MSNSRHFDTVAFDVRENATMLFFARTDAKGEIDDYLLLMRTITESFEDFIVLELNEEQIPVNELIREAEIGDCMLTLRFREPVTGLGGSDELVITFDASKENRTSMEAGAFRVLGEKLSGGHA
jgi:hypothetical protein